MSEGVKSPFHSDVVKGKVAVVTGGGSGIGFEIARQLGLHGAKIAIFGRREGPLQAAIEQFGREGIEAIFISGDVRKMDDCKKVIQAAVDKFGRLDILVNNAAGNFLAAAEDVSPNGFKTVMEIDAVGVFQMCQAAFPHLKKSGDGLILNISATLYYSATWYQSHPSAAKAAIDSLTRSFALEWGEYGIRVNGIAPGPIDETAGLTKLSGGSPAKAIRHIPLRRLGKKWDIAMTSLFLASSAGSFVTGDVIIVDGGDWLFRPQLASRDVIREVSRGIEKKSRETGLPEKKSNL